MEDFLVWPSLLHKLQLIFYKIVVFVALHLHLVEF